MGNVSTEWLAAISTGRDYSIDEKKKGCDPGCIRRSVKDCET